MTASVSRVYVLLPPSERKQLGGNGPVLDLNRLSFPTLHPIRSHLVTAVRLLAADLPASRAALKVSPNQDSEIRWNEALLRGPTMPALSRYAGVLYAALNMPELSRAQVSRAQHKSVITSALFGLLTGADKIPAYRLSAGSRVPGLPTMSSLWRTAMTSALADLDEPLLDLRSGAYAAFAPAPRAIAVRVVTVTRSGDLKPVSHENKAIKGVLAKLVLTTNAAVDDVPALLRLTRRAGLSVASTGPGSIDLVAPPAV